MLSIKIKKTDHGNLAAVTNSFSLFEFRYCKEEGHWCFFPPMQPTVIQKGKAFPWFYFYDLCQVVCFLVLDKPLWETVNPKVVSGKSYLK